MVFADFSKAFDTVQFTTVLKKMHALGFSKTFLTWTVSYLSNRRLFVQIDNKKSNLERVEFGVPQASMLSPIIFSLCRQCRCFQHADDTTFYNHAKPRDLQDCVTKTNDAIEQLGHYSRNSNLAFNTTKTNWMMLSTSQMSRVHDLHAHRRP